MSKLLSYTFLVNILVTVQGIFLTPIIIKAAGASEFGVYVTIISWIGALYGLSSLGISVRAKRYLPGALNAADRAGIFYPTFWFHIIIVLIFIVSINMCGDLLVRLIKSTTAYHLSSILLTYTLYSLILDYYRYTDRITKYNIAIVFIPYAAFISVLIYSKLVGNIQASTLLYLYSILYLLTFSVLFFKMWREIGVNFVLPKINEALKEIKFGFPLVFGAYLTSFYPVIERYCIATELDFSSVGAYVASFTIGSIPTFVASAIAVILPTKIFYFKDRGDIEQAIKLLRSMTFIYLMVSLPFVVGSYIYGKEILEIYANKDIAIKSWVVIPIIASACVFQGVYVIRYHLALADNLTHLIFKTQACLIGVGGLLNIIILKLYGNVIVVAISYLIASIFQYGILHYMTKKSKLHYVFSLSDMVEICVGSGIIAIVSYMVRYYFDYTSGYIATIIGISLSILAYIVFIFNSSKIILLLRDIKN